MLKMLDYLLKQLGVIGIMKFKFSYAANNVKNTEIVRVTEMTSHIEDIISFTVGLPAPEVILVDELKIIIEEIISTEGLRVFQYSSPKGSIEGILRDFLKKDNIKVEKENICVITGALQGGFLTCRALISPEDWVISEIPAYSINLQNLRMHAQRIIGVPMDEEGLVTGELYKCLKEMRENDKVPKFIYTIPDFQNPTGVTMSLKRRKELIEIVNHFDTLILEDTPYRYMRYEGKDLPSLRELGGDRVIHINSFSKTVATGLRVGYIVAHPGLIERFVAIKTATDYCTPLFNQMVIESFLKKGLWEKQLDILNKVHKKRRDVFLQALDEYMPKVKGLSWNKPLGGTFLWVTLPFEVDMDSLLESSIQHKVAFVPGIDFYTEEMAKTALPAMRLNFSYHPENRICEGVRRLASAVKSVL